MTRQLASVPRFDAARDLLSFPPIPKRKRTRRPPAKAQGRWPIPAPLPGAAHGTRDAALAAAVFAWIEQATPGPAWHWPKPRRHIPAAVGWLIVAAVAIAVLIVCGRPY